MQTMKNGEKLVVVEYIEVRNSRVTKSNYETELSKTTSHFELLTRKLL